MTRKPFEDLTLADDFMFCKVMEHESLCRPFLEMLFSVKIEKITYLSSQNTVSADLGAKTVRLDVLVKDGSGTSYDIEMQVGNEYNIPKRMRYYQAALDIASLDKGYSIRRSTIALSFLSVYLIQSVITEQSTLLKISVERIRVSSYKMELKRLY